MKKLMIVVLVACVFLVTQLVLAKGIEMTPVQKMAQVTLSMNHHPASADKQVLKTFSEDKSMGMEIHTIAHAMMNMKHTVSAYDKAKLDEIASSRDASWAMKALAKTLINFKHKATGPQKIALNKIMKPAVEH